MGFMKGQPDAPPACLGLFAKGAEVTKPVVAIVGRQNVGKSTLFNRIVGRMVAIVEGTPGTTRDRLFASVSWEGNEFLLVDTGGLVPEPETRMDRIVNEQVEIAIAEADLIIFLVSARDGVLPTDEEIADRLRRSGKPVLLVANKADEPKHEAGAADFYRLGLGEPLVISAYHNLGITDLLERIASLLPASKLAEPSPEMMKLAIIGRPNVGKSTLLNALIGEQRVIVDEIPGTTRDAIDTIVDFNGENVLIIDTAGIKRRGRLGAGVEKYSVIRALEAIERADIALLVLDAIELLTAQDMHIAGYIQESAKGVVLIVNKWDAVMKKDATECTHYLRSKLKFMTYAPILFVSAKLGHGVGKILPQVHKIFQERARRLATAEVNRVIREAVAAHDLPRRGGKQLSVLYATQADISPPTFVFFVNDPKLVHFSYRRYLENNLRKAFGFEGTSLRLVFKGRGDK